MRQLLLYMLILFFQQTAWSQDSAYLKIADTLVHHIPSRATKRSALIPGWGQAYNKQYWKIPLVYGVLAIPAYTYAYNTDWYQRMKFAYEARFKESNGDASDVPKMDPRLTNLSIGTLQSYRNIFRRDRDYSIMYFILAWGVNVVDATVDAHLKPFDISHDLSLQLKLGPSQMARTNGVSLVLAFK